MNRKTLFNLLILVTLALIVLPTSALCELKNLDDDGLSAVYAEGFSDFSITDLNIDSDGDGFSDMSQTYALFNIRATTYTEIDSLKLGWHKEYDYKDPDPLSETWDEDWVDIRIGDKSDGATVAHPDGFYNPTVDFLLEGFYLKADFYNIDDPTTRELKSFAFGAKHIKGDIQAVFNSFSGTIDDGDGLPEYNGHAMNLGPVTITALPATGAKPNDGFEISLNIDTYDKGYWVKFDNAIVTP